MKITVMGALIVIGGIALLAFIGYLVLGNHANGNGKSDERPSPSA